MRVDMVDTRCDIMTSCCSIQTVQPHFQNLVPRLFPCVCLPNCKWCAMAAIFTQRPTTMDDLTENIVHDNVLSGNKPCGERVRSPSVIVDAICSKSERKLPEKSFVETVPAEKKGMEKTDGKGRVTSSPWKEGKMPVIAEDNAASIFVDEEAIK